MSYFLVDYVARHPVAAQRTMAGCYFIGDFGPALLPAIQDGFFKTAVAMQPNWQLLAGSYENRHYLPAIASAFLLASTAILAFGRRTAKELNSHRVATFFSNHSFAIGHALMGSGGTFLIADLLKQNQQNSAISLGFSVAACVVGTFHKHLENKFGPTRHHLIHATLGNPKRVVGSIFLIMNIPLFITSVFANQSGKWGLAVSAASWIAGSCVSILMPRDDEIKNASVPVCPSSHIASGDLNTLRS